MCPRIEAISREEVMKKGRRTDMARGERKFRRTEKVLQNQFLFLGAFTGEVSM